MPNVYKGPRSFMSIYFASIWLLYLILSPIYIFPKGLAQPADIILTLWYHSTSPTGHLNHACPHAVGLSGRRPLRRLYCRHQLGQLCFLSRSTLGLEQYLLPL